MYNFPIALQLYSVGMDVCNDFYGTLKQVKEMGYDGVEFAYMCEKSAEEVKKMCDELGLIPISAHIPYPDLAEKTDETLTYYKKLGCEYAVCPGVAEEYRAGNEKFPEFLEALKMIGKKSNEYGMRFCYHNHDHEFKVVDGRYGLDIIFEETGKELLGTEVDTCWVKAGGEDPIEYIRKYKGNAEIVHIKDMAGNKQDGTFQFRPVGYGILDIKGLLDVSQEVGAKWIVVENEGKFLDKTALDCAKMSIDFLKNLY